MAAMREVGLIKPLPGTNVSEAVDGMACGNVDIGPLLPFFDFDV
jgi:hypothetical protein